MDDTDFRIWTSRKSHEHLHMRHGLADPVNVSNLTVREDDEPRWYVGVCGRTAAAAVVSTARAAWRLGYRISRLLADGHPAEAAIAAATGSAEPLRFRALSWRHCSADTREVGPWHVDRDDAVRDALADYAPHKRLAYVTERSDGPRVELTDDEYEAARCWYHEAILARDARGVWG